jgi:hypothetical protein
LFIRLVHCGPLALFWLAFTVFCVGTIRALTDPMTLPKVVVLPWTGSLLLFLAAGQPPPASPRLVGASALLVLVTSLAVWWYPAVGQGTLLWTGWVLLAYALGRARHRSDESTAGIPKVPDTDVERP